MYEKFLKEIKRHKNIIIFRHKKPDGDAFGSQFGLKELIENNFKEKKVFAIGENEELEKSYLKNIFKEKFEDVSKDVFEKALLIIVDTANVERIQGITSFDDIDNKVVKIDHHITSEEFGDVKIIFDKYSSTSEIISEIAEKLKWKVNKKSAEYLMTGMITDSGRFMFNSVTDNTFHQASLLFKAGAKTSKLSFLLNDRDINFIRMQGKILSDFNITGSVASYIMPKNLHKKYNINYNTASSMVFVLMSAKEIKYGLFSTYDTKNKIWKVSIRSKKSPINTIAEKYNGGGHKMASGAKVNNKKEFNQILKELINLNNEKS